MEITKMDNKTTPLNKKAIAHSKYNDGIEYIDKILYKEEDLKQSLKDFKKDFSEWLDDIEHIDTFHTYLRKHFGSLSSFDTGVSNG